MSGSGLSSEVGSGYDQTGSGTLVTDTMNQIFPTDVSHSGHHGYGKSAAVLDISHCARLKYFTPVTVAGHQSLCEISATVLRREHYIRDWSLTYSFIFKAY